MMIYKYSIDLGLNKLKVGLAQTNKAATNKQKPTEAVKANRSPTMPATNSTQLLNKRIEIKYQAIQILINCFVLNCQMAINTNAK